MPSIISKAINKGKRTAIDLLFTASFGHAILPRQNGSFIIMYHGIDRHENKRFNLRHISLDNFIKQIQWLKNNCNLLSVKNFFSQPHPSDKINVAITFDDGYENNYKYALPVLEKYKVPSTFYVTGLNNTKYNILWADAVDIIQKLWTGSFEIEDYEFVNNDGIIIDRRAGKRLNQVMKQHDFEFKKSVLDIILDKTDFMNKPEYDDYWKLISDDQIRETGRSNYVEIGSHGYYHNNLGEIKFNDAEWEILQSKKYLEHLTNKPVESIAYPDGSYSPETIAFCQEQGFTSQLAVLYKNEADKTDARIRDRFGFYPAVSWANQIYNMIADGDQ